MADSRSQMGFGHNMPQQGQTGNPGFGQNQFNMMQQQQQQQFNMMANQQMMQQANPMMMQQQAPHPMMAGQQPNPMMQQQGMPQGMVGQQQFHQAMFPGQVPQQGQIGTPRFQQTGMPGQNIGPPPYTPQMAHEFKQKSEKFAARHARQLEEHRKKLEAEHRARMFQEQQKRLKEFSAIGGRKIDADSMIKNIIGPDKARPAGAAQQAPPVPSAATAPATEPDDDGDFGDFITGPSVQNFPQSGASTQIPSSFQAQDIEKAQVQSVESIQQENQQMSVQSKTPPPVHAQPTSQNQAPPNLTQTKEEKKDLEKMMFASCDLTTPQKARTFEKRTLVKDAPKQVRTVTYQPSQKARAWATDSEKLTDLFILPGSQEPKPMDQGVEASTLPAQANQGQSHPAAQGQLPPGHITPGQIPQGQAPQGHVSQIPQGQSLPLQAAQGQTPGIKGSQVQGQIPHGLPVWCMGEVPVPEIYMMVLQASLREGKIDTELVYPILVRSGLPREVLRAIWEMSNKTVPGQLMPQELCAALALIAVAQNTMTVPNFDVLHRLPGPPIPNLGQGPTPPPTESNASSAPLQGAPQAVAQPGGATSQPAVAAAPSADHPRNVHHSGAAGAGDEDDFDDFQEAPVVGVPPSDSFGDFIVASPVNGSVGLPGAPNKAGPSATEKRTADILMGDEDKYGAFRALAEGPDTIVSSELFSGPEPPDQDGTVFKKMTPPPLSSHAHPPQELLSKGPSHTTRPQVAAFMGQSVGEGFGDFNTAGNEDDFTDFQDANNEFLSASGGQDKIAALKALVSDKKLYEAKQREEEENKRAGVNESAKGEDWDPFGDSPGQEKNKSPRSALGGFDKTLDNALKMDSSGAGSDLFSRPPTGSAFGIQTDSGKQKDLFPENDEEADSWGGFKESNTTHVKSNWADFATSSPTNIDLSGPKSGEKTLGPPQVSDWALSSSKNESDLTTFGTSLSQPKKELKHKREISLKPMSTTPKKYNYFSRNLEAVSAGVSAGTGMSALDFEPPELPDLNDNEDDDDFDKFGTFHSVDSDSNIAVTGGLSSLGAPYGMDDITETGPAGVDMFGYSSRPRTQIQPQKDSADSVSISSNEFTGWKVPGGKSSKESDSQSVSSLDLTTLKQNKSPKDGSPIGGDSQSVSSLEFGGVDRKSITPADERSVASLELKAVSTPDDPPLEPPVAAVAQNGFGEFSSATDGPNTMFRATVTNMDYIQRPRAASDLLATGDLPSIGDRYSSLVQKQEAGDQHVTEWVRCLDKCRGMLEEAANTFTSISDPTLCEEVLHSQQGTAYIQGVVEVYRVVCRITEAMRAVSATNEKLVQLLKSIDTAWLDLVTLLSDTQLKPSPGRLDFSGAVLKAEEDGAQDRACGVCLLNVDAKSKRSGTNDDHKLTYGGRQYHASCANFWVNCVASMLPALKLPELI